MTARVIPLACQEDAARAATRDREATADLVLSMAVKDAIDLIRCGRPGEAHYRLERARLTADRILGTSSGSPT